MELPEIGKQCALEICNQLDFLPVKCNNCSKTFCKDHSSLDGHNCECLKSSTDIKKFKSEDKPKCNFEKCDKNVVTKCPICDIEFCMDHRLEKDHKCSKVYENHIEDSLPKTQALVSSILAAKKDRPPRDAKTIKNQKMAAKVQLMKLKMKAVGAKSIPTNERIYFGIKTVKKDMKPVFVCIKWPFGKVLDNIADLVGLENKNNVAGAPKLKLFKNVDGQLAAQELDKSLEEMLKEEEIFNGDTLILDYVENHDVTEIDPKKYK